MLAIDTILHPTDFSERSEYAFRLACSLGRDHGARLVVLHVAVPPHVGYLEGVPVVQEEPAENYSEKMWEEFHRMESLDPNVRDLRIETQMIEGDPAAEIVRAANELPSELIVMGTHGRTGLSRLLMGSVAEQVMRKAPCPVLIVKSPFSKERPATNAAPEAALSSQ